MGQYPNDIELVKAYNRDAIDAFNEVYSRMFGMLRYYAYKLIPDSDKADEIVSDVFLKSWRGVREYESFAHLKNSLFKSVRNKATDIMRSESSYRMHLDNFNNSMLANASMHEEKQQEAEALDLIFNASLQLPAQCRLVFDMLYIKDYTFAEVADKLSITERTVRNQKARAIISIRKALKDKNPF